MCVCLSGIVKSLLNVHVDLKAVNKIYSGCTMSLESVNTTPIPGDVSPLNGSPTARDYSIFHDVIPASEASVASVVSLDSSSTCSASPFSWKKATKAPGAKTGAKRGLKAFKEVYQSYTISSLVI